MKITKVVTLRKLEAKEKIELGDFHSLDDGQVLLRMRAPDSVGKCPDDFSEERTWWRVDKVEKMRY